MTQDDLDRLSRQPKCPRCDFEKTGGAALCHRCRGQLPAHMRKGLESVGRYDRSTVFRALRAAANYFDVHFQSIRRFGGGRKR
ncbi:MAG: hypothetical protein ACRD2J_11230 [Thermoanaerobaculia bacterium]